MFLINNSDLFTDDVMFVSIVSGVGFRAGLPDGPMGPVQSGPVGLWFLSNPIAITLSHLKCD